MRIAYETKTNKNKLSERNLAQDGRPKDNGSATKVPLGKIIFGLSTIAICAKIFGFMEKIVIAYFFGTDETADIYFAVMGIVLTIAFLVKELVYPSVMPVFSKALAQSTVVASNLFKKLFLIMLGFLSVSMMVIVFFAPSIIRLLLPGFSFSQRQITSSLLRLLTPGIALFSLMMLTYTVLNAHRRFWISAIGEMGFKTLVVFGLLILIPSMGIYGMAPSICIGTLFCLIFHLCYLGESKYIFKISSQCCSSNQLITEIFKLMRPLVIGVVFSHISSLIDNLLASKLPSGNLSYLNYAKRITDAILLVGPIAVVTVVYGQASNLISRKQYEQFIRLTSKAFRVLLYISVPISCLLIELRLPFLQCLFQHGRFDLTSTSGTSDALLIYAFGVVTFSLEALFVYSFYALSDMKTPILFGIICVFIDVILAIALLRPFGHLGIASAFVISKTIKTVMLASVLSKRFKGIFNMDSMIFLLKLLTATIALWLSLRIYPDLNGLTSFVQTAILKLLLPGLIALLIFVVASYLLKIKELKAIISVFTKK